MYVYIVGRITGAVDGRSILCRYNRRRPQRAGQLPALMCLL